MSKKTKNSSPPTEETKTKDPRAPQTRAPRERWQRGCAKEEIYALPDAPTRTQRVYDAVRHLEKEGRITAGHVTASQRWIADYERMPGNLADRIRAARDTHGLTTTSKSCKPSSAGA